MSIHLPPPRLLRALSVDADPFDRGFVVDALAGLATVDEVDDGPAALDALVTGGYDVVVLALDLPSLSGIAVLTELRKLAMDVATVVLTHCDHPLFPVIAIEVGADDFCRKPVRARELALRVTKALERRTPAVPGAGPAAMIVVDSLIIDPVARLGVVDGIEVELTTKEFDLLTVLASSPGKVFDRRELLELVWDAKPEWQSLDTVTEHVYRVRQKLDVGSAGVNWIQTVRGAGYRFKQPSPTVPAPGDGDGHADQLLALR